jgi:ribosomal protein L37AE/L43A
MFLYFLDTPGNMVNVKKRKGEEVLNRKDCRRCGKPSFSSRGEGTKWICPGCGHDLTSEPLKPAVEKKTKEKE